MSLEFILVLVIESILEKSNKQLSLFCVEEIKDLRSVISIKRKNIGSFIKEHSRRVETIVKVKKYKEHLLEQLQDPKEAAAYLNAALHDEDHHLFLLALRDITEANGGMAWLAGETDLNRENLYRTFSKKGNPRFFNLLTVLDAIGLELSIKARGKRARVS